MESTDIGREAKVYESMWSEGNESRSRDHLQDFLLPKIYTIYLSVSLSRNKMKFVIALTRIIQPISLYKDAIDTSFVVPVAILAASIWIIGLHLLCKSISKLEFIS